MKKLFFGLLCAAAMVTTASADEGMWLLPYLQKMNYADMKAAGLKLKPSEIYNPNGQSLKDAIVVFGPGCTGEIVSPEGLLFTNHHCGYSSIQYLSTTEHDYLADGFWAMNNAEELPVPGLTVKFIRSIEDVTARITDGLEDVPYETFVQQVAQRRAALVEEYSSRYEGPGKKILVESFYGGNQYFLFVIDEYSDVRLVGTPPSSIGKFGGDTDNWMWPRHTGDFSIFRVYAAPDGVTPADYSPENVPYKAPVHLTISAKGYKPGDYTMIMGFPGSTTRYMSTYEIDQMLDVSNPNRIRIRGERQEILKADMAASDKVRIQYSNKYAGSANYWKNAIGMSTAVRRLGVRDQRAELEAAFTAWAQADPSRAKYTRALPLIEESIKQSGAAQSDIQVLVETVLTPIEIATIGADLNSQIPAAGDQQAVMDLIDAAYKNYNEATDKKVAVRMLELLPEMLSADGMPKFMTEEVNGRFEGNVNAYVDWLYETSVYANADKLKQYIASGSELPQDDPAVVLFNTSIEKFVELRKQAQSASAQYDEGHKLFIAGLLAMDPDGKHYPDANFTMRLTYGNVKPYSPADAVEYDYYTTLNGVIAKEDTSNPVEFTVPARLKQLHARRDYGRYADRSGLSRKEIRRGATGELRTCFLSTNDITGGNSGSGILNDRGQLIGLAFDGNWEAMSGDVVFERQMQRCINLDIRYLLFVIDKYAGAGHLLDEMTIIW